MRRATTVVNSANRIASRHAAWHHEPHRHSRSSRNEARHPAVKLVILDRDGTINHDSDEHIKSPRRMAAARGQPGGHRAADAGRLPHRDRHQPVRIARGFLFRHRHPGRDHATMNRAVARPAAASTRCFLPACAGFETALPQAAARHADRDRPALQRVARDVYMVGDQPRDLGAAAAAGARPVLVLTGKDSARSPKASCRPERRCSTTSRLRRAARHEAPALEPVRAPR